MAKKVTFGAKKIKPKKGRKTRSAAQRAQFLAIGYKYVGGGDNRPPAPF